MRADGISTPTEPDLAGRVRWPGAGAGIAGRLAWPAGSGETRGIDVPDGATEESIFELRIHRPTGPAADLRLAADVVVVGRDFGDVVLGDPKASHRHVELRREGDGVRLVDLGSTNGTWVAGQRTTEARLAAGDRFQVGETVIEILSVGAPAPRPGEAKKRTVVAYGGPAPPGQGEALPPSGPISWKAVPLDVGPGPKVPFGAPTLSDAGAAQAPARAPGGGVSDPPAVSALGAGLAAAPGTGLGPAPVAGAADQVPVPEAVGPVDVEAPTRTAHPCRVPGRVGSVGFETAGGSGRDALVIVAGAWACVLTAGIFLPWYVAKLWRMRAARTRLVADGVSWRLRYVGTGSELFVRSFFGGLLTVLTLGAFAPWCLAWVLDVAFSNVRAYGAAGQVGRLRLSFDGRKLAGVVWWRGFLTVVSFGVALPYLVDGIALRVIDGGAVRVGRREIAQLAYRRPRSLDLPAALVAALLAPWTGGMAWAWYGFRLRRRLVAHTEIASDHGTLAGTMADRGIPFALVRAAEQLVAPMALFLPLPWILAARWSLVARAVVWRPVSPSDEG